MMNNYDQITLLIPIYTAHNVYHKKWQHTYNLLINMTEFIIKENKLIFKN